jgi:hypothetical protein
MAVMGRNNSFCVSGRYVGLEACWVMEKYLVKAYLSKWGCTEIGFKSCLSGGGDTLLIFFFSFSINWQPLYPFFAKLMMKLKPPWYFSFHLVFKSSYMLFNSFSLVYSWHQSYEIIWWNYCPRNPHSSNCDFKFFLSLKI